MNVKKGRQMFPLWFEMDSQSRMRNQGAKPGCETRVHTATAFPDMEPSEPSSESLEWGSPNWGLLAGDWRGANGTPFAPTTVV